jgi:hypothetical protein
MKHWNQIVHRAGTTKGKPTLFQQGIETITAPSLLIGILLAVSVSSVFSLNSRTPMGTHTVLALPVACLCNRVTMLACFFVSLQLILGCVHFYA